MPLALPALQAGLQNAFAEPPATVAQCAQAWADAVQAYAAAVVPPSPQVASAAATLATALQSAFSAPDAAPGMESAFTNFALTVGAGMAPAFVAVPPPGPVGFPQQFAGPKPATHAAAAQAIATLIDTWMKTGSATPAAGGPPVPWS
jgi:hypothetical protein